MSIKITLRAKCPPGAIKKQIEAKSGAILNRVKMILTEAELMQLLHDAMDLVIYDVEPGSYKRTNALYASVKTARTENGLAVWVDGDALASLNEVDYSVKTALDATAGDIASGHATKSGKGYFMPAFEMILKHVIGSMKNTGNFKLTKGR